MTARTPAEYLAVGGLPGTPRGGKNYTTSAGSVPYGEVAERYEAGTVSQPDYYESVGNNFKTRRHL